MHFCSVCQNMYYIRLDGEENNNIIYYCRKCGNEDDTLIASLDNICVSKTTVKKKEGGVKHIVNEYTKLDPTLPRVTNIPCPNDACVSNRHADGEAKEQNEVIYLRYNDAQLKFVYICSLCDTVWKSAESK